MNGKIIGRVKQRWKIALHDLSCPSLSDDSAHSCSVPQLVSHIMVKEANAIRLKTFENIEVSSCRLVFECFLLLPCPKLFARLCHVSLASWGYPPELGQVVGLALAFCFVHLLHHSFHFMPVVLLENSCTMVPGTSWSSSTNNFAGFASRSSLHIDTPHSKDSVLSHDSFLRN